jgi:hypothetical protein
LMQWYNLKRDPLHEDKYGIEWFIYSDVNHETLVDSGWLEISDEEYAGWLNNTDTTTDVSLTTTAGNLEKNSEYYFAAESYSSSEEYISLLYNWDAIPSFYSYNDDQDSMIDSSDIIEDWDSGSYDEVSISTETIYKLAGDPVDPDPIAGIDTWINEEYISTSLGSAEGNLDYYFSLSDFWTLSTLNPYKFEVKIEGEPLREGIRFRIENG